MVLLILLAVIVAAVLVWDVSEAFHETTPTRERICLNGLWRWQPAETQAQQPPTGQWGFFKVPGSWPGITAFGAIHKHPD